VRRLVMLAAAALALTACGGAADTADTESAAPQATATTAAATTTTAVNVAADKAKARALVFTRSDLPAGWKATPHQDDPTDKKFDAQLAACLGRPSPTTYLTAGANSQDFTSGDAEVSSEALLVKTVADFNADVDAVKGPKFIPCVKRVLTSSLQQLAGPSVRSVAVAPLPVDSDLEFSAGFRATVKLQVQGQTVTVYQDGILLGKERIELTASFSDVQQPPDPALEKALVAKLGAKLDAA
jgi:hypothetical protein